MVCLGNICRSPLAEGILKTKIKAKGLDWEVDSAGTNGYHDGELPDKRSIAIAKKYGVDITNQRSRKINQADLEYFDTIFVMDSSNYNDVMRLCTKDSQKSKIQLITNLKTPDRNIAVPDPYWDDNGFEKVYALLEESIEELLA